MFSLTRVPQYIRHGQRYEFLKQSGKERCFLNDELVGVTHCPLFSGKSETLGGKWRY